MVQRYKKSGYIKSKSVEEAMLKIRREDFMDSSYVNYAYVDQPFPIPGDGRQTISAPYMYPIFLEPLQIKKGNRILEIGAGSGYGAALSKELVGPTGLVVSIEINEITYNFARENLKKTGYDHVNLILSDGSIGYPKMAPYDAICITAACPDIPTPLINQMKNPGRIMAPIGSTSSFIGQDLILLEKNVAGEISKKYLMKVAFVPLLGKHGWDRRK
jgi:protein-L-isoaspartate(D-aspartate) O-methyltransferase